ncbi:MAG TPA: penicillin-binding protein 2 [Chloroflexi bacterium]|jgi:cell division protein FtsI/penicillin-binding protein 2|nr:penicillin-binding protein 2 [Chloroflexota bacterium]
MSNDLEALGQRRRVIWLGVVFLAVGLILVGRLAWWQLVPRQEITQLGLGANDRPNVIPAIRGGIVDATGHHLAISTVTCEIAVAPQLLEAEKRAELVPWLAAVLDEPEDDIAQAMEETGSNHVILGRNKPVWVGAQIEDLGLAVFSVTYHVRRTYPDGGLAAPVLGFVDYQSQGQYGLERQYDRELAGVDGTWYGVRNTWGEHILVSLAGYRPAQDGVNLALALDRNIQHAAETLLSEAVRRSGAEGGNLIVMDPRTGAILAMTNYPAYQPGAYWEVDDLDRFVNTSISAIYEPGSVFKPLTLAAALEAGVISRTDTYDDRGEIIVGDQRIMNSDRRAHGVTTMTELLAYSRNVGAAHVATLLGPTRFYEMMRRFGMGEVTGIDLAYESAGIMRVPGNPQWHMSDLGTNSFGQGISTTPLQVVAAYGALANNGLLMRPYVVAEVHDGDTVEARSPVRVRRVLSAEVAREITEMMADAVDMGMHNAVVPGYRMAGKSGTSQIAARTGYQERTSIASFIGYGPLPDPRFVVLVKIDKPQEGYWGEEVAAPVFREMCEFLVDYYGIPPTR